MRSLVRNTARLARNEPLACSMSTMSLSSVLPGSDARTTVVVTPPADADDWIKQKRERKERLARGPQANREQHPQQR